MHVETHFWWPNLPGDMREVFRVVKPGGTLVLIAEVDKGANTMAATLAEKYASRTGMTLLSVQTTPPSAPLVEEQAWLDVPKHQPSGEAFIFLFGIVEISKQAGHV